jgi:hypothetical protein
MLKKAAMFGLDARIALSIFGALSIISGAALFSAIQDSKVTAYVTEMKELAKAIESYMLDVGTDIPKRASLVYQAESQELVTSSAVGWKGPYFTSEYNAQGFYSKLPDPDSVYYIDLVDDTKALGGAVHSSHSPCSTSAASCSYWVRVIRAELATAKAIDLKVDGSDDDEAGNVRYSYHVGTDKYFVWLKGPRTLQAY